MPVTIPPVPDGLEATMFDLVFSKWDADFLQTPAARRAIDDVVFARFECALRYSVPWLQRAVDLSRATIVEVGCGSGSSTAALAMHCARVVGVDIDDDSVTAAAARCAAYGLDNVELHAVPPHEMLDRATSVEDPDVCVLYAVLEHQTYDERLTTLATLWEQLPEGGHLVVVETPNRFTYMDHHTSEAPFFHLLPDELAFRYLDRVPRAAFRDTLRRTLDDQPEDASEHRIRWGLGVSYHEFELALDEPLDELVVADGYEQEMLDFFPVGLDEELLTRYFVEKVEEVPIAFARAVLNLTLRKPASDADRAAASAANARRRDEVRGRLAAADAGSVSTDAVVESADDPPPAVSLRARGLSAARAAVRRAERAASRVVSSRR